MAVPPRRIPSGPPPPRGRRREPRKLRRPARPLPASPAGPSAPARRPRAPPPPRPASGYAALVFGGVTAFRSPRPLVGLCRAPLGGNRKRDEAAWALATWTLKATLARPGEDEDPGPTEAAAKLPRPPGGPRRLRPARRASPPLSPHWPRGLRAARGLARPAAAASNGQRRRLSRGCSLFKRVVAPRGNGRPAPAQRWRPWAPEATCGTTQPTSCRPSWRGSQSGGASPPRPPLQRPASGDGPDSLWCPRTRCRTG